MIVVITSIVQDTRKLLYMGS